MRGSIVVLALVASPFVASVSSAQGHSHTPKRTDTPLAVGKCKERDRGNSADVASSTGLETRADPTLKGNKDCPQPEPAPGPVATGHTSVSGTLFNDPNANGYWDDGEPGIAGFTVQLSGPVNKSVLTDGAGFYAFTNLEPGTYTVCVVPPAGWLNTLPTSGASCPGPSWGFTLEAPALAIDVAYSDYNFGFKSM